MGQVQPVGRLQVGLIQAADVPEQEELDGSQLAHKMSLRSNTVLIQAAPTALPEAATKRAQAKGTFGQRRPMRRLEAELIQEAEASLLGGALAQWQAGAEGVAAVALDARLAERRLLLAAHR